MQGIENVPAEIVKRLLERGYEVATRAAGKAAEFTAMRDKVRASLSGIISKVSDEVLDGVGKQHVTAVDGGLVCESRSIGDLCTAVGVTAGSSVESGGCDIWMDSVPRSPHNKEILSGVMSSLEVMLASGAPGDVVMIDGAMLSTLINVSKSIREARSTKKPSPLTERALASASDGMRDAVMEILGNVRFVAMPKYTTTNEFAALLPEELAGHDARTIATMALRPGEMTDFTVRPASGDDKQRQLIGPSLGFSGDGAKAFAAALDGVSSCYYRPHPWTPAFRLDMTAGTADDEEAILRALRAVRDTTTTSGLREPFPLYLADMFAKQVSVGASPVVEMASLSSAADPEAKLLLAMGYRS